METIKAWNPALLVSDRFRYNDLLDSGPSCPIQSRIGRWSESSEDIRATRKMALDGNLAIEERAGRYCSIRSPSHTLKTTIRGTIG